jgi:hypothetical protein
LCGGVGGGEISDRFHVPALPAVTAVAVMISPGSSATHGVREPDPMLPIPAADAGRVPPPGIEREPVHRFPVRQASLPKGLWTPHGRCDAAPMMPLKLVETSPGKFSLLLNAGTTAVDDAVERLGRDPGGYFWEGVARFLVSTQAPALEGRFKYDPEASMFCAYGEDRAALEQLGSLMSAVAGDADRMRQLIASATASGFEFDD